MVVFHPPHNSLRRLGETVYSMDQDTTAPASPIAVVPGPAAVTTSVPTVPDYDRSLMNLSPAGLVVGGIVVIGLALTVSNALARR
jgi:hypothetical protein